MSTVNEDLFDDAVDRRLRLLRYEAGIVGEVTAAFDEAVRDAVEALVAYERRLRKGETLTVIELAQLAPLRDRLTRSVREAEAEIREAMDAALFEAAGVELDQSVAALRIAMPPGITVRDPAVTPDALVSLLDPIGGRHWHDRLADDLLTVHDRLQAAIAVASTTGLSMPHAAQLIGAATDITETYRGRLVAIARTEIQRVSNDAALATYAANVDVVGAVQYLATLDSRTCPVCAPDHNEVYKLDATGQPVDAPTVPRHPRCRCFYAPVTRSWRELGITGLRDGAEQRRLDGSRAENTTFDAWLRKPANIGKAESILGPKRAQLFREGVALERFTDGRTVLTLGQLRDSGVPGV